MKQLLFIMTNLRGGGAEKSLIELLGSIDYNEYKVSLCLMFYQGVYLTDIPKEVKVIRLFKKRETLLYLLPFGLYKICKKTSLISLLLKIKIRNKYDVILSAMEGHPLFLHRLITDKGRLNISWIHCDLHQFHYTKNLFHNPVSELSCYEKMDRLVFVSQTSLTNFNHLYRVDVPKYCLYNVVDTGKIIRLSRAQTLSKPHFTITTIGSLIPVKGFDRLIRVARMLKDSGYSFRIRIIGEGPEEEALVQLQNRLGLQEEIQFTGFQKNPYPYLKQSDMFVSTSVSEGLPYVICEAFVLGIPVVATKTAGSAELLGGSDYGILTGHDDTSICNGIKQLIDHPELRDKYKEKSLERAKIFTKEQVVNGFYQLIHE